MKLIFIISGFIFLPVILYAGNDSKCHRSTEGTDFWFGFMENRIYNADYHTIQITVASRVNTNFYITIGLPALPTFNRNYTVEPDIPLTIEIPWKLAESNESEIIQNKGIHLTSEKPVAVFAINWDPNSTDITTIYPVETLGKEYIAMCYEPHIDPENPSSGAGRNSEFMVVATEDQTTIKITPSKVTDRLVPKDSTFVRVLNKGEVFQVQSENEPGTDKTGQGDLTGSRVEADKPVAFFSGALSTTVPNTFCCWDHLFEQIPPVQSWGREYYTVPFLSREKDLFRILAASDNTTVQISGKPFLYLNEGEFSEFELLASDAKQILADKPILVAQFSQSNKVDSAFTGGNGDPFMLILNPAGRGVVNAVFDTYAAPKIVIDSAYVPIKKHFVNIISRTTEVPNIRLDGQPLDVFKPYTGEKYSYAQIEIEKGKHTIENLAGNEGFIAYVYGFGGYESYGFSAGYNLDITLDLGKNIEFFSGDTILLCHGDTLLLDAGPQFDTYNWNTGENTQSIWITNDGKYSVEAATGDGCFLKDSVFVKISTPVANLGPRFNDVCYPEKIHLDGGDNYEKYIWQNEKDEIISTDQKIWADKMGEYRLTVIDMYRCEARDTFGLTVFPVPEIKINGYHLVCGVTKTQLTVTISGTPEDIWDFPGNYTWKTNSTDLILLDETRFSVNVEASKWGDFDIYYNLVTVDGCDTVITFPIRFHPQPDNDFTIVDDPVCSGYSKILSFTGKASDAAFFDWNLNGRVFLDTIDLQNRIYLISSGAMQYADSPISLAINDKGCLSDSISKPIPDPKSNFSMIADKTRGCDSLTVNFEGKMLNADMVDYSWTFDDTDVVNQQNVTNRFPNPGFFKVNLTVVNPVTKCRNSFTVDSMIRVFPTPLAAITADPSFCYSGSALLVYTHHIDSSFCIWEFGGNTYSGFGYDSIIINIYHPVELVKLTVEEFGCKSETFDMNVKRKPNFDFSVENEEGCQPYTTDVFAKTTDPRIEFAWITDTIPFPGTAHRFNFPDTGRFDIGLIATSFETGCVDTLVKPDYIWVHQKPLAKFEVDYPIALLENATISYINYSENATNYFWDFGDSLTSTEISPMHTFNHVDNYRSQLISESEFGCADTFSLVVRIIPSKIYAPNAFRPDSEITENKTFMPVGIGVDSEATFTMKIFNRWGELIFETDSPLKPWDGTVKNGEQAPVGNYIWISVFSDIQGFEHHEKGQVMLIR